MARRCRLIRPAARDSCPTAWPRFRGWEFSCLSARRMLSVASALWDWNPPQKLTSLEAALGLPCGARLYIDSCPNARRRWAWNYCGGPPSQESNTTEFASANSLCARAGSSELTGRTRAFESGQGWRITPELAFATRTGSISVLRPGPITWRSTGAKSVRVTRRQLGLSRFVSRSLLTIRNGDCRNVCIDCLG